MFWFHSFLRGQGLYEGHQVLRATAAVAVEVHQTHAQRTDFS